MAPLLIILFGTVSVLAGYILRVAMERIHAVDDRSASIRDVKFLPVISPPTPAGSRRESALRHAAQRKGRRRR